MGGALGGSSASAGVTRARADSCRKRRAAAQSRFEAATGRSAGGAGSAASIYGAEGCWAPLKWRDRNFQSGTADLTTERARSEPTERPPGPQRLG